MMSIPRLAVAGFRRREEPRRPATRRCHGRVSPVRSNPFGRAISRLEPDAMRQSLVLIVLLLTACSSAGGGPYPSLQPRAAEAIDPRVQPVKPMNDRPVSASLAAQL